MPVYMYLGIDLKVFGSAERRAGVESRSPPEYGCLESRDKSSVCVSFIWRTNVTS
ncbi:hypothetical protein CY34DRAFT_808231 [Suillus luteus UH-Slu-Lm8-n1]|uniref:Uncharacterized protein n=1 Tax=Suillus luteus UH-Slu-Lm8-n1 TaxID=930992 RepID=A0A0D0ANE6_9AGAM|nr:hypothetical protein CY34DRAFT_808231 [Suillus luteus UH-Slu-Lm8-n1]